MEKPLGNNRKDVYTVARTDCASCHLTKQWGRDRPPNRTGRWNLHGGSGPHAISENQREATPNRDNAARTTHCCSGYSFRRRIARRVVAMTRNRSTEAFIRRGAPLFVRLIAEISLNRRRMAGRQIFRMRDFRDE